MTLDYFAPLMHGFPAPAIQFIFDTARTVDDIITFGTVEANLDLKWIISHCGGAIASVLDRFVRISSILGPEIGSDRAAVSYNTTSVLELMRRQFWFHVAGFSMQSQIWTMARLFGPDKFTYDSDVPFTAWPAALALTGEMNVTLTARYSENEIEIILRGNASKLFSK